MGFSTYWAVRLIKQPFLPFCFPTLQVGTGCLYSVVALAFSPCCLGRHGISYHTSCHWTVDSVSVLLCAFWPCARLSDCIVYVSKPLPALTTYASFALAFSSPSPPLPNPLSISPFSPTFCYHPRVPWLAAFHAFWDNRR